MTTAVQRPPVQSGWLTFAGVLAILMGSFNILEGLFAIFSTMYKEFATGYVYVLNLTGWGWLHLILGVILVAVGWGVLNNRDWARGAGIGLAGATAIIQMLYLPIFPWWSLINIGF